MSTQFLVPYQRTLIHAFHMGFRVLLAMPFNAGECFVALNSSMGGDEEDSSTVLYFFPHFATSYYHHCGGTMQELLQDMDALFQQVARVTQHALFMLRHYLFMSLEPPHYVSFVERYQAAKNELKLVERACCSLRDFDDLYYTLRLP